MLLKEYLKRKKLTIDQFAAMADMPKATVYAAIERKVNMGWISLYKIMEATEKQVDFSDLAPRSFKPKKV